jgi:hypothetical protein
MAAGPVVILGVGILGILIYLSSLMKYKNAGCY